MVLIAASVRLLINSSVNVSSGLKQIFGNIKNIYIWQEAQTDGYLENITIVGIDEFTGIVYSVFDYDVAIATELIDTIYVHSGLTPGSTHSYTVGVYDVNGKLLGMSRPAVVAG